MSSLKLVAIANRTACSDGRALNGRSRNLLPSALGGIEALETIARFFHHQTPQLVVSKGLLARQLDQASESLRFGAHMRVATNIDNAGALPRLRGWR